MQPVGIELKPDMKPYASKYYNVPKAYDRMARTEVNHLCTVNVLEKLSHNMDSPWAAPSIYQLNVTGDFCFLTNFREVNKCIQRKPFPLPRINESLQKIEKFKSATTIDLFQGYYSIPLSKKVRKYV